MTFYDLYCLCVHKYCHDTEEGPSEEHPTNSVYTVVLEKEIILAFLTASAACCSTCPMDLETLCFVLTEGWSSGSAYFLRLCAHTLRC